MLFSVKIERERLSIMYSRGGGHPLKRWWILKSVILSLSVSSVGETAVLTECGVNILLIDHHHNNAVV